MRKLFLASFTFNSADKSSQFTEQRIIAVESIKNNNKTEDEWLDAANEIAKKHVERVVRDTEATFHHFTVHPTMTATTVTESHW